MLRSVDKKKATGPFFLALPQRKLPAKQTSNMLLIVNRRNVVVVVVVVSHIQRIGCQPEKTTLHGGQSRSWPAEQGERKRKTKNLKAPPPFPPPARGLFGGKKKKRKKETTRRIHIFRRYASRRYAGGFGPSRIRTRIPTTRQLGQWVSLHKTLRFRVRLQLSQSRCLSLLLAMSGRDVSRRTTPTDSFRIALLLSKYRGNNETKKFQFSARST